MHRKLRLQQPLSLIVSVNLKRSFAATSGLLVTYDSLIPTILFQYEEDVIQYFPINLLQHIIIECFLIEPNMEYFYLSDILSFCQIDN